MYFQNLADKTKNIKDSFVNKEVFFYTCLIIILAAFIGYFLWLNPDLITINTGTKIVPTIAEIGHEITPTPIMPSIPRENLNTFNIFHNEKSSEISSMYFNYRNGIYLGLTIGVLGTTVAFVGMGTLGAYICYTMLNVRGS